MCGVQPGGRYRLISLPSHPGEICPFCAPGNTQPVLTFSFRANNGGHGIIRTLPPFPTTLSVQPPATASISYDRSFAHSSRRRPHVAITSIARAISAGAWESVLAITVSGTGFGTPGSCLTGGTPVIGLFVVAPVATAHAQNVRSDARADARAALPHSWVDIHRIMSWRVILSSGFPTARRHRRMCDERNIIVPFDRPRAFSSSLHACIRFSISVMLSKIRLHYS